MTQLGDLEQLLDIKDSIFKKREEEGHCSNEGTDCFRREKKKHIVFIIIIFKGKLAENL